MHKKIAYILLIFVIVSLQFNCGGCGGSDDELIPIDTNEIKFAEVTYDSDAINEIIQSFSSPVEMAAMLNSLEVPFSKNYLVETEDATDYDTNFKKAIALGILSADLGYLNVYGRTSLIVEYLTVIKRIADDLKVGQFFDFQTLKRLSTSNDNLDSLLILSVQSYHNMDDHLRSNQRSNLSALVVTGVWIESLYLATQVLSKAELKDKELIDRVGEQKTILNSLLPILKLYKNDQNFERLVDDFNEIKNAYEGVSIKIEVGEPESKIINGELVIMQNEKSIVEITDEQLQEIIYTTEKIRNKLIAL